MIKEEYFKKAVAIAEIIYPQKDFLQELVNFEKLYMADAIIKSYDYLFKKGKFIILNTCLERLEENFKMEENKVAIQKLFEKEYQICGNKRNKNLKRFKSICKSIAHGKCGLQELEALLVADRLLKSK